MVCIGFIDIVVLVGKCTVNLFVVLTTLDFAPDNTYQLLSGIKFQWESSIGNHILSALLPALSPLKVKTLD